MINITFIHIIKLIGDKSKLKISGGIKTLFEYDAINITIGLPFIRITPDHGPNELMVGKNKSNPTSLIKALNFLDKND